MKTFDCSFQLVITQTRPDGSSAVFTRTIHDCPHVDMALLPSFFAAFHEALETVAALMQPAPAADAPVFWGQLSLYLSDGTKKEQNFPALNFAGAQALMHAGIDLLAGLANLPYQPQVQASLAQLGITSTLPSAARGKLRNLSWKRNP